MQTNPSNPEFDFNTVAEIEITYKTHVPASLRPTIKCSADSYQILARFWNQDIIEFLEEFKIILLNRANRVLGICPISTGGITGTVADPRIILATAIKANAVSIILSHNHPSGNLTPSSSDIALTQKIKEASRYLDLQVLDHIILTKDCYYSFADEGRM
jgi:DNA repair protein RadC